MGKVSFLGICMILFVTSAGAISVENLKKVSTSETELWDPVLSPDGTKIAYIAYDNERLQQIFIVNIDGTEKKKITNDNLKKWGLAWGPEKMAYISLGTSGLEKIYVINPDGTENRQLILDDTRQGNFERYMVAWAAPSWSHDGKSLLYTSLNEKADPKMYIVNADGTGKKSVLNDAFKQWSPSWSPDGKSIVYVSYPGGKNKEELFTVAISGTERKQLTFDEIKKNYPVWGPEGSIAYVSYETVTSPAEKIFVINQDGTNKGLFVGSDFKQRYPSFSLDGKEFSYAAIDISGTIRITAGDIAGITGTAQPTPVITTSTPEAPAKTTPKVEKPPEEGGGVLWTMFSALAVIIIILLALLVISDFLKKK